MFNTLNRISFIILFFTLFPFFIFPQDDEVIQRLQWEPVDGITNYQVEIRQNDTILFDLNTENTLIEISLFPGIYQYRIGLINKFGKLSEQSEWLDIRVNQAMIPQLRSLDESEWFLGEDQYSTTLNALQISDAAQFKLNQGTISLPLYYELNPTGQITLTLENPLDLREGFWDLEVINPSGKKDVMNSAIQVRPYWIPQLSSISAEGYFPNEILPEIELFGDFFDPDCRVYIKGSSEIPILKTTVLSSELIKLQIDVNLSEKGKYSIEVINPNGESTLLEEVFEIYDIKILERQDRSIPGAGEETRLQMIQGGYQFSIPVNTLSEQFAATPIGLFASYKNKLNNPAQQKLPVFRELGFEVRGEFSEYDYLYSNRFDLRNLSLSLGIFYGSDLSGIFNYYLGLKAGYMLSIFQDYQGNQDGITLDFFYGANLGINLTFKEKYLLDTGVSIGRQEGVTESYDNISLFMGVGLWLN